MHNMIEWSIQKKNRPDYGTFDQIPDSNGSIRPQFSYQDYLDRLPVDELKWGRYKVFLYIQQVPLVVIGPHWPFFLFAYSLFWIVVTMMLNYEMVSDGLNGNVTYQGFSWSLIIASIQLFSYLWVFIKNPGIANIPLVTINNPLEFHNLSRKPKIQEPWYCEACRLIQPPRTAHCEFCSICIYDLDHHCPWTGKCVGKGNMFQFFLFVMSTVTLLTTFIIMTPQQINK